MAVAVVVVSVAPLLVVVLVVVVPVSPVVVVVVSMVGAAVSTGVGGSRVVVVAVAGAAPRLRYPSLSPYRDEAPIVVLVVAVVVEEGTDTNGPSGMGTIVVVLPVGKSEVGGSKVVVVAALVATARGL